MIRDVFNCNDGFIGQTIDGYRPIKFNSYHITKKQCIILKYHGNILNELCMFLTIIR